MKAIETMNKTYSILYPDELPSPERSRLRAYYVVLRQLRRWSLYCRKRIQSYIKHVSSHLK